MNAMLLLQQHANLSPLFTLVQLPIQSAEEFTHQLAISIINLSVQSKYLKKSWVRIASTIKVPHIFQLINQSGPAKPELHLPYSCLSS